jgi:hypothetical protein
LSAKVKEIAMLSVKDTERAFENGKAAGRKEIFDALLVEMAGMKYPTPENGFDRVGDVIWHIEMGAKDQNTLQFLQTMLPGLWTQDLYSKEFQARSSPYKDFQHALLHEGKAINHLNEMVEEADHLDDPLPCFPKEAVEKYVADLVICALRLAIKNPSGEIDLKEAVIRRIERKMGVRLARKR